MTDKVPEDKFIEGVSSRELIHEHVSPGTKVKLEVFYIKGEKYPDGYFVVGLSKGSRSLGQDGFKPSSPFNGDVSSINEADKNRIFDMADALDEVRFNALKESHPSGPSAPGQH